jgi:glycosyltransferase involved in cell wall biosynthesis
VNLQSSTVSVIVPTRDSARTLEACVDSIRSQLYRPIELVVVDNQSSDNTREIASRYADIVENSGPERSAQRNRGAQLAHGEYLLFVDSDMTLSPHVIGECFDAIHISGAPGVIIPETSIGNGFLARCRELERSCYIGDNVIEGARFFPRKEFERVGGYDEQLHAMEDWDLSLRIAAGRQLARVESYITHDEGDLRLGSMLAKKRYYAASSLQYWRKHGRPTLGQANLIFRPAFFRNWRRLMRHPVLTFGFLTIKTLESGAGVLGLLDAWANRRFNRGPNLSPD